MKRWMISIGLVVLAGCQTLPDQNRFAARQIQVLEAAGFEQVGDNFELGLEDRLLFDIDQSAVKPEMVTRLNDLGRTLLDVGISGARIEGHADSTGAADHNARLSQNRADAVKATLIVSGMAASRVESIGLGESDPISSNETEDGRAQNRRVVVMVRSIDLEPS